MKTLINTDTNFPIETKKVAILSEDSHQGNLFDQRGQTLVEFVMLLLVIMTISFTYMSVVNRGIATYWENMGNVLLLDVPQKQTLKLR